MSERSGLGGICRAVWQAGSGQRDEKMKQQGETFGILKQSCSRCMRIIGRSVTVGYLLLPRHGVLCARHQPALCKANERLTQPLEPQALCQHAEARELMHQRLCIWRGAKDREECLQRGTDPRITVVNVIGNAPIEGRALGGMVLYRTQSFKWVPPRDSDALRGREINLEGNDWACPS